MEDFGITELLLLSFVLTTRGLIRHLEEQMEPNSLINICFSVSQNRVQIHHVKITFQAF
jgi:hypothetical protein